MQRSINSSSITLIISRMIISLIFLLILSITQKALAVGLEGGNGAKLGQNISSSGIRVDEVREMKVGLILDEGGWVGKVAYSCIRMAISDFYASHPHFKTRVVLHTQSYNRTNVLGAASAALHLINDVGVKAIIGPLTSRETNFVINIGTKAQVPIISYSATSPILSPLETPYFIRATQNDIIQVQAIGALIQAFGWKEVVFIYGNNEHGEAVMPYLLDNLQEINSRISYQITISSSATEEEITEELETLKKMQTRVFVVHMWPSTGLRLFRKAKDLGMISKDCVWIVTSGMGNLLQSLDRNVIKSMQGALVLRTFMPRSWELENFTVRWPNRFKHDHPNMIDTKLNVYGLWAYDAILAMARALEEVGPSLDLGFMKVNNPSSNSTNLDGIRVSNVGPMLLQALLKTKFKGLAGNFNLSSKGEIQSSMFHIINVVGNGWKDVGFWTPTNGLMKDLSNNSGSKIYSTSKDDLQTIVWPGDSFSIPRGWVIPDIGKKLRIGVPVRPEFQEFLKVIENPKTKAKKVIGFCADVFDTVMAELPYHVGYEYFPFAKKDGTAFGTYDDLTNQVHLGKYDAIAGDVTIIANRTQYIDYTLPYTESGVVMVAPLKENKASKAWLFLKPLTWDLWVTTFIFFVFIGFVVWVLEHRVNEDFRGPPMHQAGTMLYYSFSTMVFAHHENVFNNLSRFIMVVWTFVVFILTQSYTASLTSMLTVQQLQPVVQDMDELIKTGQTVGYQQGSFVYQLLKQKGFQESKLRVYKDCEELDQLLSKGSGNGGIAAVFDEVPYMKLFVAKYCHKYTMVKTIQQTGGFGFVFPKGSPLVSDVSGAILKITEDGAMEKIEKKWIKMQDNCTNSNVDDNSSYDSLGLESFWGLFLIVGLASVIALGVYTASFLSKYWHVLNQQNCSVLTKLKTLAEAFDDKDESSHKFRKRDSFDDKDDGSSSHKFKKKDSFDDKDDESSHKYFDTKQENEVESRANTQCPPSPSDTETSIEGSPSSRRFYGRVKRKREKMYFADI